MNAINRIITAGIYDMPSDDYHQDPTETPSLSAGMINDLLIAPAKCFENSRRLNPNWEEPEGVEKFSIGTVSHIIHLEEALFHEKVVVCEFDDWRKGEAKAMRADAKAAGKTAILAKHMIKVRAARDAFYAHQFTRDAFAGGMFEQSLFWKHPIYGFWCRARPDFLSDALTHLCDYKATANAAPSNFGRHAYNLGYHRRAAHYLQGFEATFATKPKNYWFVNQEIKAPYLTSVVELDWTALEAGQDENDHAAGIFARCLDTGNWPGYRDQDHPDVDRAFRVGLPSYAYMEIDRRLGRDAGKWTPPDRAEHQYEEV